MSNPRKSVGFLKLSGSPNVKRSLEYGAKRLEKSEDLRQMYDELMERRRQLLAEIKRDGFLIDVEKSARGVVFMTKVTHPSIKVLQTTERTILAIAKVLIVEAEPEKRTVTDSFDEFEFTEDIVDAKGLPS